MSGAEGPIELRDSLEVEAWAKFYAGVLAGLEGYAAGRDASGEYVLDRATYAADEGIERLRERRAISHDLMLRRERADIVLGSWETTKRARAREEQLCGAREGVPREEGLYCYCTLEKCHAGNHQAVSDNRRLILDWPVQP